MKKILLPLLLILAVGMLAAVESEPSEIVGYFKINIPVGVWTPVSIPFQIIDGTVLNIFEINGIIEPHSFWTLITEKNSVKEIEPDVVKVGSVYIITEEKYQYLRKSLSILMDLLGTSKRFIQAHDASLNK